MDIMSNLEKKQEESLKHEQLERVQEEQNYYVHNVDKLMNVQRSEHQKQYNIGGVRENIEKKMPEAYDELKKIQRGEKDNKVRLHHSRGTQLFNQGENVLEFDISGSGYKQFPKMHKSLGGKTQIKKRVGGAKISVKINEIRRLAALDDEQLNKELSKYSQEDPKQIEQRNAILEHIEQFRNGRDLYEETYGKKEQIKDGKEKKYVLSKQKEKSTEDGETITKKRITMAGPLGGSWVGDGLMNAGDYSIENLREYMLSMGQSYLEPIIQHWYQLKRQADQEADNGSREGYDSYMAKIHPVTILLKGHSRGGVAMSHGAMMIKYWLHDKYPEFEKYVKFETIHYDPVAGFLSNWNAKQEADISDKSEADMKKMLEEHKMMPLGDEAESTVVYSLHTQHKVFFAPQILKGTKRMILTPFTHDVGLDIVDTSQEKAHRGAYTDAKSGEVYRNSGINSLDEGVYIADENQVLVKVTSAQQARSILEPILEKVGKLQFRRRNRIYEAIEAWFAAHPVQEQEKESQPEPEQVNAQAEQSANASQLAEARKLIDEQNRECKEKKEAKAVSMQALKDSMEAIGRQLEEIQKKMSQASPEEAQKLGEEIIMLSQAYAEQQEMLAKEQKENNALEKEEKRIQKQYDLLNQEERVIHIMEEFKQIKPEEVVRKSREEQMKFLASLSELGEFLEAAKNVMKSNELHKVTGQLAGDCREVWVSFAEVPALIAKQAYDAGGNEEELVFANKDNFVKTMNGNDMGAIVHALEQYIRYQITDGQMNRKADYYDKLIDNTLKRIAKSPKQSIEFMKQCSKLRIAMSLELEKVAMQMLKDIPTSIPEKKRITLAYFLAEKTRPGQELRGIDALMLTKIRDMDIDEEVIAKGSEEALKEYGENKEEVGKRVDDIYKETTRTSNFSDNLAEKDGVMKLVNEAVKGVYRNNMSDGVLDRYDILSTKIRKEEKAVSDELQKFRDAFRHKTTIRIKGVDERIQNFVVYLQDNNQSWKQKASAASSLYHELERYTQTHKQKFENDQYAKYSMMRFIDKLKDYEAAQKNMGECRKEISQTVKANKNVTEKDYEQFKQSIGMLKESYHEYQKSRWAIGDSDSYKSIGPLLAAYVTECGRTENYLRSAQDRRKKLPEYVQLTNALKNYRKSHEGASSKHGIERLGIVNRMLSRLETNEYWAENYAMKIIHTLV